ncbi:MAG: sulfatase-modifying factor protein, partial [Chitinophagaceae bacterium]
MKKLNVSLLTFFISAVCSSQQLKEIVFDSLYPFTVKGLRTQEEVITVSLPLFSLELNGQSINSGTPEIMQLSSSIKLNQDIEVDGSFKEGYKVTIQFSNSSKRPISVSNIVPFGANNSHCYISGKRLSDTSHSFLYQPGKEPIGVVVPHNNNDLNFTAVELGNKKTLYALLRRSNDSIQNYLLNRTPCILQPGKTIRFDFYADIVAGDWHAALRKCFQEKMLYEVKILNNALYEREDLKYIRHSFTMHLMMAWEKNYYSRKDTAYKYKDFLLDKKKLYGGDDIFTIWPTWPMLGLDQRTQWNLIEDLPGGLIKQKELAALSHSMGTKYFISYNPWDDKNEKTSLQTMSDFIKKIDADGVVLDTRAEGSDALQQAADKAKPGVILYSEGMAAPKDMQGIISGRVHNDIYYVPLLNLNKLIKPDFAIFRVAEVNKERIRREYSLALFNGYGVEINVMRPGRQEWMDEDYRYWGRCVRILKENSDNFISKEWTPLISSLKDKIYINKWPGKRKTIYTIFSLLPEGYNDALFEAETKPGYHYVDLWNHEELQLKKKDGKDYIVVELESFNKKYLGTNNEGVANAIIQLPQLLDVKMEGDKIFIDAKEGTGLKVWVGNPSYDKVAYELKSASTSFHLFEKFGRTEGKYVIQLFDGSDLLDENILYILPGTPLLVSESKAT